MQFYALPGEGLLATTTASASAVFPDPIRRRLGIGELGVRALDTGRLGSRACG